MKKYQILFLALLIVYRPVQSQQMQAEPKSISLVDELKSLYDISLLPGYFDHTIEAQVSSYDTTGGNDDGFNGKYSFIRKNEDGSLVIFDMKGPGVINRIATPTPTEDTLDFYIDDERIPALSVRYLDLFSGKQFPFVSPLCGNQLGGYYCYFPIVFQSHCKIVCRGKKMQFHQIQYRLFQQGTKVIAFHLPLNEGEKDALEKIDLLWNQSPEKRLPQMIKDISAITIDSLEFSIKKGETKKIFERLNGGRILGISFDHPDSYRWNRYVDIRIRWDDDTLAAIYCPIEDFFGYAFGEPSMQSLLLGSGNRRDYCYFPMPFDKHAVIDLIYRWENGATPLGPVKAKIYYANKPRNPSTEGKFYSCWNNNILPAHKAPHVLLDTKGKGHYVGTILQSRGLRPGMTYFFEGDDSTAVDGIPRIHGTGSEDYFNGGWYAMMDRWDRKMSLPLHGSLDYSLLFCRTGGYRLLLADKISFGKNIYQSIEHGPEGNSIPAAYTSLALYYCSQPPADFVQPSNALSAIVVPDTLMIYPQLMKFGMEGDIHMKSVWAEKTGGESFVFTTTGESWLNISMDNVPYGKYKLYADFTRLPEGADFSLWQHQTQLTQWISASIAVKERAEQFYLADMEINDFNNSVTIRLKSGPESRTFFFNRFILVREK